MKRFPRFIGPALLALGAVLLAFLGGRASHEAQAEAEAASSASPGSSSNRWSAGGASFSKSDRRPSGADTESSKGTRTRGKQALGSGGGLAGSGPRGIVSAQTLLEKKEVPLFDEEYAFNPEIGTALGLSDVEYGEVNATLTAARQKIDALRGENIEVRRRSDSQMFLKVRSFHEQGAELRTFLEESLRAQLGEERYASFMLVAGENLDNEYFQFGRAYQTISLNHYTSRNDGQTRFRIVDELHIPQGDGTTTIVEIKDNYDTLPDVYQGYLNAANAPIPGVSPVSPPTPSHSEPPSPAAPVQPPSPTDP